MIAFAILCVCCVYLLHKEGCEGHLHPENGKGNLPDWPFFGFILYNAFGEESNFIMISEEHWKNDRSKCVKHRK